MIEGDKCKTCKTQSCLIKCQYIDINQEDAKVEILKIVNGEDSHILSECIVCFACQEYCELNARPFDQITKLQEKYGSLNVAPPVLEGIIKQFAPHDDLRIKEIDPDKPVFHKCGFRNMNKNEMQGQLFDDLQYISGTDFFCNMVYHHVGKDSIPRERAPLILENIIKHGVKELICWHDECYGFLNSYCPRNGIDVPFKVVHLFEYLYDYLKEHESDLKKLNMKVAYQRNCSNRFSTDKDLLLDKVFDLIGVERVARKYDRENALCCAASFAMKGRKDMVRKILNKNVDDIVEHGAEAVVYNCPMCKEGMASKTSRKGLKNYLVSDLCRLALGEELNYIK